LSKAVAPASQKQLWLDPLIGGFFMVAANFIFNRTVHQLYSKWFVAVVTISGFLLLVLGAFAVRRNGTRRAQSVCCCVVAAGLAMAGASAFLHPA
jgi:VIT1/CCC1 family predicted Fe2+/Mn2+ transporter